MYLKTANLLTGETEATMEEQAKVAEGIKQEIISHWHPNITINIVNDYTNWIPGQVIFRSIRRGNLLFTFLQRSSAMVLTFFDPWTPESQKNYIDP